MPSTTLTKWYDRLSGLLRKLPKELHGPILKELSPVREFFLASRAPRVVFVGGEEPFYPLFLKALCGRQFRTVSQNEGWTCWKADDGGRIEARGYISTNVEELNALHGDLVFLLHPTDEEYDRLVEPLRKAIAKDEFSTPVFIAEFENRHEEDGVVLFRRLDASGPVIVSTNFEDVPDAICEMLPPDARLEMARISNARKVQREIAETLLKSFAAICGVIGLQPIPLADLPVLISLQTLLIGLIIHASGRKMSARSVAEFMGAMGVSVGAAFVFREGARALVRFLPIWGSAVSGGVAAIGTYAIGKSAIAYFIDGLPQHEVRKLFKSLKNRRKQPKLPKGDNR